MIRSIIHNLDIGINITGLNHGDPFVRTEESSIGTCRTKYVIKKEQSYLPDDSEAIHHKYQLKVATNGETSTDDIYYDDRMITVIKKERESYSQRSLYYHI